MIDRPQSTLPKFYRKSLEDRRTIVKGWGGLNDDDLASLADSGLSLSQANVTIENVIGRYSLPFSVATNFLINDRDYLVPMVIEESSVVAACSYAAKLFRAAGGFSTSSDESVMIGQIQILDVPDLQEASAQLIKSKPEILAKANETAGSIARRGGGAVDIETRHFPDTPVGDMLILHLLYDSRDAMGANAINSALEYVAPLIEYISGGRVNLRILSNLSDRRKARASGRIYRDALETADATGEDVVDAIIEAAVFAELDPYRAATHNKGIMNGVDSLLVATGNDWRAVEAGAHAYAAKDGHYRSLTKWWKDEAGDLCGELELPMAVGIVGGATRVHRGAQTALKLLGVKSARELAEVAATVGLAQNLAAIRALATDGIQSGHMRMHARQLALAAGADASGVSWVALRLIDEGNIRLERAKEIVSERKRGK